jgi:tetratricopeptide (TPR) repeat protein
MNTTTPVLVLLFAMVATPAGGQERHVHHAAGDLAGLGTVTFANSGAKGAQTSFLRGLALLHSFEYDQAAEAFRSAQAADPAFAMAFWGEALTYSHLLWGEDDVAGARAALARLAPTREARVGKAGTPRERAFGEAIEALFVEADPSTRIRGFLDATRRLAEQHPKDADALAFASLASMFAGYISEMAPAERDAMRSAAIDYAQRVFDAFPDHPGGAHYLIHACDNPEFAARGLAAARRYAEIAPDAEHALHMPSHIFVQLGLWPDTVASNVRSWAASRKDVETRKLSNARLSFHALLYEQYAYLQLGQYAASRAALAKGKSVLAGVDLTNGEDVDARHAVSELAFQHAANTGDWSAETCRDIGTAPAPAPAGASDRDRIFRARAGYRAAIASIACGTSSDALEALRARVKAQAADDSAGPMRQMALRHAELIAYAAGRPSLSADTLLADPAVASRAPVGPPPTLRLEELLGQARLKAGKPREAVAAYEKALKLTPNRSPVLLGLARARRAAGDAAGAADAYRKLLENWKSADRDLPELAEVRDGAALR